MQSPHNKSWKEDGKPEYDSEPGEDEEAAQDTEPATDSLVTSLGDSSDNNEAGHNEDGEVRSSLTRNITLL